MQCGRVPRQTALNYGTTLHSGPDLGLGLGFGFGLRFGLGGCWPGRFVCGRVSVPGKTDRSQTAGPQPAAVAAAAAAAWLGKWRLLCWGGDLLPLVLVLGSGCCWGSSWAVLFTAVVVVGALRVVLVLMDGAWCWWDLARGVHGLIQSVTDFDRVVVLS